jgi:hypothetical protein
MGVDANACGPLVNLKSLRFPSMFATRRASDPVDGSGSVTFEAGAAVKLEPVATVGAAGCAMVREAGKEVDTFEGPLGVAEVLAFSDEGAAFSWRGGLRGLSSFALLALDLAAGRRNGPSGALLAATRRG